MTTVEGSGLSALLPLEVSGRHYGENLARFDLFDRWEQGRSAPNPGRLATGARKR